MPKSEPGLTDAAARRSLAAAIAGIDAVLPGSVVIRHMRCGKAACRCKADPPTLHGPYIQWTRTVAGKDGDQVPHRTTARPLPGLVRQRSTPA